LVDYLLLGRSASAFCKDPSPSSLEGSVGRGLFFGLTSFSWQCFEHEIHHAVYRV